MPHFLSRGFHVTVAAIVRHYDFHIKLVDKAVGRAIELSYLESPERLVLAGTD